MGWSIAFTGEKYDMLMGGMLVVGTFDGAHAFAVVDGKELSLPNCKLEYDWSMCSQLRA